MTTKMEVVDHCPTNGCGIEPNTTLPESETTPERRSKRLIDLEANHAIKKAKVVSRIPEFSDEESRKSANLEDLSKKHKLDILSMLLPLRKINHEAEPTAIAPDICDLKGSPLLESNGMHGNSNDSPKTSEGERVVESAQGRPSVDIAAAGQVRESSENSTESPKVQLNAKSHSAEFNKQIPVADVSSAVESSTELSNERAFLKLITRSSTIEIPTDSSVIENSSAQISIESPSEVEHTAPAVGSSELDADSCPVVDLSESLHHVKEELKKAELQLKQRELQAQKDEEKKRLKESSKLEKEQKKEAERFKKLEEDKLKKELKRKQIEKDKEDKKSKVEAEKESKRKKLEEEKEAKRIKVEEEKEAKRIKVEEEKEAKRIKVEEEKEAKRKKLEEVKAEKERKKEEEKAKKEDERLKKIAEKEERLRLEKQKKEEEKAASRSQMNIMSFLVKNGLPEKAASNTIQEKETGCDFDRDFLPFSKRENEVMAGTKLSKGELEKSSRDLDNLLKESANNESNSLSKFFLSFTNAEVIPSITPEDIVSALNSSTITESQLCDLLSQIPPIKYLSFYENSRPPYIGTWFSRKHQETKLSHPTDTTQTGFDYGYDSDLEWDNDDEGEDLGEEEEDEEEVVDDDDMIDDFVEDNPEQPKLKIQLLVVVTKLNDGSNDDFFKHFTVNVMADTKFPIHLGTHDEIVPVIAEVSTITTSVLNEPNVLIPQKKIIRDETILGNLILFIKRNHDYKLGTLVDLLKKEFEATKGVLKNTIQEIAIYNKKNQSWQIKPEFEEKYNS